MTSRGGKVIGALRRLAAAVRPSRRDLTTAEPGRLGPDATIDLAPELRSGLHIEYAPDPDGRPDPGEIVWTWVPYVEHDGRGKDRPVLLIARLDETNTVGCYLSTKNHDSFVAIGSGAWGSKGRESYVSLERFLQVHDGGVRREGNVLGRAQFDAVARAVRARLRDEP